jgi:adenosylcobinamide-phosphate synthase
MADPVAFTALILDATIGWPKNLYAKIGHPVGGFARIINACAHWGNRDQWSDATRCCTGIFTVALLVTIVGGIAYMAQFWLTYGLGKYAWIAIAALAWPALAQRSLMEHVRPVAEHLTAGNTIAARQSVGMIVGRDTETLDSPRIARAAIESLAESFCDGVAAPLFWLLIGGLPAVWAYKAINTADSLIGHKEPPWGAFGWAAARSDDALNFIPARLAGCILCIAGGGGWQIMLRDARKHASPNAGWTEAAMAGALKLRLAGPICYDGITHIKPWIGDGHVRAAAMDIVRAMRIYGRACLILWVIAGGIAWAL